MSQPKPQMETRVRCVSVMHFPQEIRESLVPPAQVKPWCQAAERAGRTAFHMETVRVPVMEPR